MRKRRHVLILDDRDVRKVIDIKHSIKAVEGAFREYGRGKVQMPPKVYIDLRKYSGDFRAMPAYIEGLERCSLKWVNAHAGNKKHGLPAVMAIIILSDPKTGLPLCIMDGTYATSLRTGAAGAVAARYLARPDSRIVGLVGCGVQAAAQLEALRMVFRIQKVKVWGHTEPYVRTFINKMKKYAFRLTGTETIEECVRNSDMVITTTPSRKPLVKLKWLKPGTHINAIGADARGKQELEPAVLKKARVVVDCWEQACHSGEVNVPLAKGLLTKQDIYADIGQIVSGRKKGRRSERELTVFDSTGLAVQDTAVAHLIYSSARHKKIGKKIAFP